MRSSLCLTLLAAGLLALAGCGQKPATAAEPSTAKTPPAADALTLEGPGGSVTLGDDLEAAKKAFPAPEGSQIFDSSMSFMIVTQTGWCWSTKDLAFEAATKDGKIVGLALTQVGKAEGKEPEAMISKIGEPTRKEDGKTAKLYVWERGDNARFWGMANAAGAGFEIGGLTLIGKKADLKMLNYDSDHPETFVKQLDSLDEALKEKDKK